MPRPKRDIPWLDQRDNGVYYVYWYDAEKRRTRQLSLHTTDPGEASSAFGQFLLHGRTIYEDSEDGLSATKGLDQYLKEHVAKKCADPTRQHDAARHLKEFFEGTLYADIDIPMSRAYADARRAGEIGGGARRKNKSGSDSTIRRELNVLIASANHAIKWKRLSAAEAPSVELPTETSKETPWYTHDELKTLLEAADGHLLRFIRLAYWTAGRRRSVTGLHESQLNWISNRIDLRKPGERTTVKRRAIVPIYDEIRPDIEWLLERAEDGMLFGNRAVYKPYKSLCIEVGLENKSHPHILRHTRATHLLQRGVSIYDVAKLLGDTVATVERTYGHHSSEYLAATTGEM